ncbi:MAG: energy transducer TonB [Tenacibaculum sp.]
MVRLLILVLAMFTTLATTAQEQCDTPDESVADPNSITKCAVEEIKNADGTANKQVTIQVSTRRRVVRKNSSAVALDVSDSSHKIADIKKNSLQIGKLELENANSMVEKIPFNLVEEIPLFPKCEKEPLIKQAKCFDEQMSKHILNQFNYPEEAIEKGIEGRVLVQFTINKLGAIEDIKMRSPQGGEILEKETLRLIKKLPKFIPGKHNGEVVKVKYGLPVTFRMPYTAKNKVARRSNKTKANEQKTVTKLTPSVPKIKEENINGAIKFTKVQSIPQFKACSSVPDIKKLNCFNERMISHIQRNFNYPSAAVIKNIEGKVWVTFIINSKGKVRNIRMRGPENGEILELEAKRMVSRLPNFIPGKHDGKYVNVEYTIPINFKLDD